MESGLVFNLQRFSLHDGPGIRTTVFLKGCPLRCRWCHNPESMSSRPEIIVAADRCIACGTCVEVCPHQVAVIPAGAGGALEAPWRDECAICGTCVEACPTEARQLAGRRMTVGEVMAEVAKDRIFYDDSGGGVTLSGGEPFNQPDFLFAMLAACRAQGIHTAVDTSGLVQQDLLLAAADLTDLFLYDIKVMDASRHRQFTGASNAQVLANLEALANHHRAIWLRVPVVPGVNDDAANLEATARLAASLPSVEQICLLPYHQIGTGKLDRLGKEEARWEASTPSPQRMRLLAARVEAAGVTTRIGG